MFSNSFLNQWEKKPHICKCPTEWTNPLHSLCVYCMPHFALLCLQIETSMFYVNFFSILTSHSHSNWSQFNTAASILCHVSFIPFLRRLWKQFVYFVLIFVFFFGPSLQYNSRTINWIISDVCFGDWILTEFFKL